MRGPCGCQVTLTYCGSPSAWHPQGPIHPQPSPVLDLSPGELATCRLAPGPALTAITLSPGGGVVPQNVVARGGWVDVGGPCGCQASRPTLTYLVRPAPGLTARRSMYLRHRFARRACLPTTFSYTRTLFAPHLSTQSIGRTEPVIRWERFLLIRIHRSKPTGAGLVGTTHRHRLRGVARTRSKPTIARNRSERAGAGPEGNLLRGAITRGNPPITGWEGTIEGHCLS